MDVVTDTLAAIDKLIAHLQDHPSFDRPVSSQFVMSQWPPTEWRRIYSDRVIDVWKMLRFFDEEYEVLADYPWRRFREFVSNGYMLTLDQENFNEESMNEVFRVVSAGRERVAAARQGVPESPIHLNPDAPFGNIVNIGLLVTNDTIIAVHDPYLDAKGLLNLGEIVKNAEGASFGSSLRMIGKKHKPTHKILCDWMTQYNVSNLEMRLVNGKAHRRFMLTSSGKSVDIGCSFNEINHYEKVHRSDGGQDLELFDKIWSESDCYFSSNES